MSNQGYTFMDPILQRRIIPTSSDDSMLYMHNLDNARKFAQIRQSQLIFVTKNLEERPRDPRSQNRLTKFDTTKKPQMKYYSKSKADDYSGNAFLSTRPSNTRRSLGMTTYS